MEGWEIRLREAGRLGIGTDYIWPHLHRTLRAKQAHIDHFAHNNVTVVPEGNDIESILDDMRHWTAAVHFTKAYYFGMPVHEQEEITVTVFNGFGGGSYESRGPFKHAIRLGFMGNAGAVSTLDAECSHAHHWNAHFKRGIDPDTRAGKALATITEVVDDVKDRPAPISLRRHSFLPPFHFDPYINDFFVFTKNTGKKNGYVVPDLTIQDEADYTYTGTNELRCFLSERESERRAQQAWLIRQTIRPMAEHKDELAQEYLRRLTAMSEAKELQTSFWTRDHPNFLEVILDFYTYRTMLSPLARHLHAFREFNLETTPFQVNASEGVYLGRTITTFASQLDYIALKLLTTKPSALHIPSKKELV